MPRSWPISGNATAIIVELSGARAADETPDAVHCRAPGLTASATRDGPALQQEELALGERPLQIVWPGKCSLAGCGQGIQLLELRRVQAGLLRPQGIDIDL